MFRHVKEWIQKNHLVGYGGKPWMRYRIVKGQKKFEIWKKFKKQCLMTGSATPTILEHPIKPFIIGLKNQIENNSEEENLSF